MTSWLVDRSFWQSLHDPGLRSRHTYQVARRATTASGRVTPHLRLFGCLLVLAAGLWAAVEDDGGVSGDHALWLGVISLPVAGAALAVIHGRAEVIFGLTRSAWGPVRLLGRALYRFSWNRVNLPGILETIGPLVMAWMVGAPSGPFTGHPAAQLVGAAATVLFSALGTLHWATDSIFYQPEKSKAWPVEFARLMRAGAPLLLALVYGCLLSRNTSEATSTLPVLAGALLLVYPAVTYFEHVLRSSEMERRPAVVGQRLADATVVHARISNPLHFVVMAVRERPQADAEALMVYLRGELERCLKELDHGHAPASLAEVAAGVRDSLLPQDRERLVLDEGAAAQTRLSSADASLARCVLSDLCCNALKETRDGQRPRARVGFSREAGDALLILTVTDDGPGFDDNWQQGVSLHRLGQLLRERHGALEFETGPDGRGVVATAQWQLEEGVDH
ncbi:hypothetical protein ACFYN5_34510 [Streptomyces sp. NPDC007126]|uniref:hypothetical protein n=1 Tax=Streptomyces sp. NPDC007126 TaxID=3364774 RepID=UPI0036833851